MANGITYIKKVWHFVTEKIWRIRLDKVDSRQGFLLKQLRIFTLSIKGFNEDKCLTKATALTYYTIFSIVPILALVFAIAKGFGYDKTLQDEILANYPRYADILKNAFVYADSMLATTKGGVIAGFGVVLLLWSVMKLLISIEDNFNEIWEINKGRTWVRKITDYLTVMLVSPILLIVSGALTVAIQTKIGNMHMLGFLSTILVHILAYLLIVGVFTFLYLVMPNTKVNFRSAFFAGLISTILFELLQWVYIKFQIGANQMNAIYGGFAALPLFLIWLQYSWYVVLFGAELAFANQNVDHYELENEIRNMSARYKRVIALVITNLVVKNFNEGNKALTAPDIAKQLDLPMRLARVVVNELVELNLFSEIKTQTDKEVAYQPALSDTKLTVKFVIDKLDEKGVNELPISNSKELETINRLMDEMDQLLNNEKGSILIKDIG